MIAPLHPDPHGSTTIERRRRRLRHAHEILARTLFNSEWEQRDRGIAAWKAWLGAGWATFVLVAYVGSVLGWW